MTRVCHTVEWPYAAPRHHDGMVLLAEAQQDPQDIYDNAYYTSMPFMSVHTSVLHMPLCMSIHMCLIEPCQSLACAVMLGLEPQ